MNTRVSRLPSDQMVDVPCALVHRNADEIKPATRRHVWEGDIKEQRCITNARCVCFYVRVKVTLLSDISLVGWCQIFTTTREVRPCTGIEVSPFCG